MVGDYHLLIIYQSLSKKQLKNLNKEVIVMYWYGVDLHTTKKFTVAQLGENDKIKIFQFYLDPDGIKQFKKMLTKQDKVAIEASTNAFWFYDNICDGVLECKVINPKRFEVIYKSTSKTDKKDAKLIAKFLKLDLLPEVYVPEKEIRELRSLFSSYRMNNKIKVMAKNRIHSLLRGAGISISKRDIKPSLLIDLIRWEVSEIIIKQVEIFLEQIRFTEKQIEKIKDEIYIKAERYKEDIEIISSETGISVLTAIGIISDVVTVERFPHHKKMISYLGCAPKVDSSNGVTRIGKSHKESRKLTKTMMLQGINHFRNSSDWIENFYQDKIKGKRRGIVRIAIVRKKLVGIYYMLKRREYSKYRNETLHKRKMEEYERRVKKIKAEREDKRKKREEEYEKMRAA